MSEPGLAEKLVEIHRALDAGRLAHAFGGAIALAYYAEPRATVDIDCNVFVGVDARSRVVGALAPIGVAMTADGTGPVRDGQERAWWGRTPVDLYFSYDEFHDAMARGVRQAPFGEATIMILGPEHLVVCKAVFDRRKDWLDIEQVLVTVPGFEVDEVRRWLPRIVGADDPRVEHVEQLFADVLGR